MQIYCGFLFKLLVIKQRILTVVFPLLQQEEAGRRSRLAGDQRCDGPGNDETEQQPQAGSRHIFGQKVTIIFIGQQPLYSRAVAIELRPYQLLEFLFFVCCLRFSFRLV